MNDVGVGRRQRHGDVIPALAAAKAGAGCAQTAEQGGPRHATVGRFAQAARAAFFGRGHDVDGRADLVDRQFAARKAQAGGLRPTEGGRGRQRIGRAPHAAVVGRGAAHDPRQHHVGIARLHRQIADVAIAAGVRRNAARRRHRDLAKVDRAYRRRIGGAIQTHQRLLRHGVERRIRAADTGLRAGGGHKDIGRIDRVHQNLANRHGVKRPGARDARRDERIDRAGEGCGGAGVIDAIHAHADERIARLARLARAHVHDLRIRRRRSQSPQSPASPRCPSAASRWCRR